jgi:phage major head subunit gpT-like protein
MVPMADKIRQAQLQFSAAFLTGVEALKEGVDILWPMKAEKIYMPGTEESVYGYLAEMPLFRDWEGEREAKRLKTGSYSLRTRKKEYSYSIQRDDLKFDRFGIISMHGRGAGVASQRLYEDLVNDTQAAGTTTLCADGQFFYDTDHPSGFDGVGLTTFSNYRTGSALNATNVMTGYVVMTGLVDANGKKLRIRPNILEHSSADIAVVRDMFQADLIAKAIAGAIGTEYHTASNTSPRGLLQPVENPELPQGTWYLHDTRIWKPFIVQVEEEPVMEMRVDPTDPNVWQNDELLFGGRARCGGGYTMPHLSQRNEQ